MEILIAIIIIAVVILLFVLAYIGMQEMEKLAHLIEEVQILLLPVFSPRKCQKCSTPFLFRARFCYHCGSLREERDEKTCKTCGMIMPSSAMYCPHCRRRMWFQGSTVDINSQEYPAAQGEMNEK